MEIQRQISVYTDKLLSALSEQLHNVLKPEDADQVMGFIDRNGQLVCIGIGVIGLSLIGKKLLGGDKSNKKKSKKKRHHKKKHESLSEALKIDPIKVADVEIDRIMKGFDDEFRPGMEKLFKAIDERIRERKEKGKKGKGKKEGEQKEKEKKEVGSYKDAFEYQYLYYNESLLKLLMKLDGVDTLGKNELRSKRKEKIHEIQEANKQLDEYKGKIEELARRGISE